MFRFEQCEVQVGPREVVLKGHRQRVEPLAFDLLLYLLEHRDRVVAKDELLERVWNGRCVSVGVLARAVFKARQAIGDTGKAPALIRTLHRKGYRFACTVEREGSGGASGETQRNGQSHAAMPPPRISTVSLALLPFENLTGQPDLDWIELGLMSVVAKALAAAIEATLFPEESAAVIELESTDPVAVQTLARVMQAVGRSRVAPAGSLDGTGPSCSVHARPCGGRSGVASGPLALPRTGRAVAGT